jgi:hypothetical protein
MPITIKDIRAGAAPVQRNIASLVGGVVIAVGCFILWMLDATELTNLALAPPVVGGGILFALIIGIWIRVADL